MTSPQQLPCSAALSPSPMPIQVQMGASGEGSLWAAASVLLTCWLLWAERVRDVADRSLVEPVEAGAGCKAQEPMVTAAPHLLWQDWGGRGGLRSPQVEVKGPDSSLILRTREDWVWPSSSS